MPHALCLLLLAMLALHPASALAQAFEFAPAPHQGINRLYRIDTTTGEVSACQYGLREGTIGVTLCYPAGEGARAGAAGEYALLASRHNAEAGVFRVNRRTGEVSVCYVQNDEQVVCTPPQR